MADEADREIREEGPEHTQPAKGKVQKLRQKWAVQEDGALAHKLQKEEYDRHYDLNHLKRRTARQDISVAQMLLTDDEIRQQDLTTAVADGESQKPSTELTDEEYAIALQEQEKRGYGRYLEKEKHPKSRKPDRCARQQAGHASVSTGNLEDGVSDLHIGGHDHNRREHPSRTLEGDRDPFGPPDHLDPAQQRILQEKKDEELARQLQEQEQMGSGRRGRGRGRREHNHSGHYQGRHNDPSDTVGHGSYQFS
ncbi:uncharacterized protein LOC127870857 isoform X2 [Dreissena polymorpha]|uniref:uncharacterized protein LOC127870857 isoform X2 n=1 Tax=Dreissena polymorpha TaxID=45954 RepID=UPI0022644B3D|nr:uncharacterized protein LOC127870857 isoform X2 [Dreissena polymorpha]